MEYELFSFNYSSIFCNVKIPFLLTKYQFKDSMAHTCMCNVATICINNLLTDWSIYIGCGSWLDTRIHVLVLLPHHGLLVFVQRHVGQVHVVIPSRHWKTNIFVTIESISNYLVYSFFPHKEFGQFLKMIRHGQYNLELNRTELLLVKSF